MADEYKANSNLVLQAKPAGEVLSHEDKLEESRMGDRHSKRHIEAPGRVTKHKKLNVDEMAYDRITRETFNMYEEDLLNLIQETVGYNENRRTVCIIADEILAVLKNEHLKEQEKKREFEILLGSINEERFALLVNLGTKIIDFGTEEEVPTTGETSGKSRRREEPEEENEKEGEEAKLEGAIHDERKSDEYVKLEDFEKMHRKLEKRIEEMHEELGKRIVKKLEEFQKNILETWSFKSKTGDVGMQNQ